MVDGPSSLADRLSAANSHSQRRWLARGVTAPQLVTALTSGLPPEVYSAGAFARRRLTDKMPPEPVTVPTAPPEPGPVRRWIQECTACGVPGRPEALPGGLCRACRGEPARRDGANVAGRGTR